MTKRRGRRGRPRAARTKREQKASALSRTRPVRSRWVLGAMALVVLAAVVAYLPALRGEFIWDDDAHVTKPALRSVGGLYRIWFELGATQQYYPLLHSAFWGEHRLWGDLTLGYHLANLLLHLCSAALLYLILEELQIPGALLAAAIFALHPVHVESVAWISEQKNTLSAVFYLSAMLVCLRFDQTRRRSLYALALGLFALGLMTKTVTATLPAALLVIFWWQRGRLAWERDVLPLIPFFVLGATAGLFTAWAERNLIGAHGEAFEITLLERVLLAGRVPWFYLGKLVWPANLIFIYPRWDLDPSIWAQWFFPVVTVAVTLALWFLRHRWRAPLAAWLFFVGTLFPVLGFFNVYPFVYSFVADHFQYLASLGIIVLGAAALSLARARLAPSRARSLSVAMCLALLGTLGTLTWRQSGMYRDAMTVYETTLARNPACWMAHNNLSRLLIERGRTREAIEHSEAALRLKPTSPTAHNTLGLALAKTGRPEEAIEHYLQSLRFQPDLSEAHNNLGVTLAIVGRREEARKHFEGAARLKADYPDPLNNLGNLLLEAGRVQDAMEYYRAALKLNPDYAEAHTNLGRILDATRRPQEAIAHFERAVEINPNLAESHYNLGAMLAKADRYPEAIARFQTTVQINPQYLKAHTGLAMMYAATHRPAEATAAAQRALELARAQGQTTLARKIEDWLVTVDASSRR